MLSVRFKRPGYQPEVLPDRLITTIVGTCDPLTEVRNAFATKEDVDRRLGYSIEQADKVSYLGIDLGQTCVAGREPRIGGRSHNRHRGCKSNGRRNKRGFRGGRQQGSKGSKKKKKKKGKKDPSPGGMRHIELFGKQKAVSQPTLKHRSWMEAQKRRPLNQSAVQEGVHESTSIAPVSTIHQQTAGTPDPVETSIPSISTIESAVSPLRGANGCFSKHVDRNEDNKEVLDKFYNGNKFFFKRHKWHARRARQGVYYRLADGFLRMVGGSIGEKKDKDNPVVVRIGLGRFRSTSGLSSLHGTFEEFFHPKEVPPLAMTLWCETESLRRLYCSKCGKYRHRDVLAGHNICNILKSTVEQQERPLYLQPMNEDGSYVWMEKDGKNKDQQAISTSPSPNQAAPTSGKRHMEHDGDERANAKKQAIA
ncbi:hypothetical protein DFQ27_001635 [Actinomortierella ambigua]|uniref:Uncharacterized protein n=1 Tax=Actinomortierella ambigua TaxID=1343610 RepID=A0A9P6QEB6_9FUNG|nr:hypothetical protein DFQ27_001635 [Actinomortierella ambigua]